MPNGQNEQYVIAQKKTATKSIILQNTRYMICI